MQSSTKTVAISAFAGLVVGLLVGFLPMNSTNTDLQEQNSSLTQSKANLQGQLNVSQNRLHLSSFAVHAGEIAAQANSNNYSVASSSASGLFTDLRTYVDSGSDSVSKQGLREVLARRDETIAGLAQANPAVKPLLQQIFSKLQSVSVAANGSKS